MHLITTQAELRHRKSVISQIANLASRNGEEINGEEKFLQDASTETLEATLQYLNGVLAPRRFSRFV